MKVVAMSNSILKKQCWTLNETTISILHFSCAFILLTPYFVTENYKAHLTEKWITQTLFMYQVSLNDPLASNCKEQRPFLIYSRGKKRPTNYKQNQKSKQIRLKFKYELRHLSQHMPKFYMPENKPFHLNCMRKLSCGTLLEVTSEATHIPVINRTISSW